MNNIQIVEYNNIRVLTTQQVAEAYQTSTDIVTRNFNRNKNRYTEGKHYFCLKGEELRAFKANGQIDLLPSVNTLYLWTQKGCLLHAKSLNTDIAWEVYDQLVDNYFDKNRPQQAPTTIPGQIQLLAQGYVELETKIDSVKKDLESFKNDMPILGIEETKISKAVKKKGIECLGGKESNAYNDRSLRSKLYSDLHRQLRREFDVSTYKAIKCNPTETALSIIQHYVPPLVLLETIKTTNAQQVLDV